MTVQEVVSEMQKATTLERAIELKRHSLAITNSMTAADLVSLPISELKKREADARLLVRTGEAMIKRVTAK